MDKGQTQKLVKDLFRIQTPHVRQWQQLEGFNLIKQRANLFRALGCYQRHGQTQVTIAILQEECYALFDIPPGIDEPIRERMFFDALQK